MEAASPNHVAGCTIVTVSYLPYARVLASAWREVTPNTPFFVLVVDADDEDELHEAFEVLSLSDLDLAPADIRVRRGIYTAYEFALSMKPHLLRALLDRGFAAALYVDPDSELLESIADVGASAATHGVALVPHFLTPLPSDGQSPSEQEQLEYGVYTGALIGVGTSARPFLEWWAERTRRDCLNDPELGFHGDQRWLDFVPVYFPHTILTDPTIGVAWWNLHERLLGQAGDRLTVNGAFLRHAHFSGFDPEQPRRLTRHDQMVHPTRPCSGDPLAVASLYETYGSKLLRAGYLEARRRPYRFATSAAGLPLNRKDQRAYRSAVLAAEVTGGELPPDPFDPAQAADFHRRFKSARRYHMAKAVVYKALSPLPGPLRRRVLAAARKLPLRG